MRRRTILNINKCSSPKRRFMIEHRQEKNIFESASTFIQEREKSTTWKQEKIFIHRPPEKSFMQTEFHPIHSHNSSTNNENNKRIVVWDRATSGWWCWWRAAAAAALSEVGKVAAAKKKKVHFNFRFSTHRRRHIAVSSSDIVYFYAWLADWDLLCLRLLTSARSF